MVADLRWCERQTGFFVRTGGVHRIRTRPKFDTDPGRNDDEELERIQTLAEAGAALDGTMRNIATRKDFAKTVGKVLTLVDEAPDAINLLWPEKMEDTRCANREFPGRVSLLNSRLTGLKK